MAASQSFRVRSRVWKYPGMAGWYFLTVDRTVSAKIIKTQEGKPRRGWGSIPVTAKIGRTEWQSSIFPDKDKTYLLPLKAAIRTKEGIDEDDHVSVLLTLRAGLRPASA